MAKYKKRKLIPVNDDDVHIKGHIEEGGPSYIEVNPNSVVLMMDCMLVGAINDFLAYKDDHVNFKHAQHWLFHEEAEDLTSFFMCCNVLGLNRDKVRFVVQEFRDRNKPYIKDTEFTKIIDLCK